MDSKKVLAVLAGTDLPIGHLVSWAESADSVIAADGAANRLLSAGVKPDIVVGDMDSIDPNFVQGLNVREDANQEHTDCDKLLALIERDYPDSMVAMAGIEGDRFDHVLASLYSISKSAVWPLIVLRDGLGRIVRPNRYVEIPVKPSDIVSLLPIMPCSGVRMVNVQWAPAAELSASAAISISNLATSESVRVEIESGTAILIHRTDSSQPRWT